MSDMAILYGNTDSPFGRIRRSAVEYVRYRMRAYRRAKAELVTTSGPCPSMSRVQTYLSFSPPYGIDQSPTLFTDRQWNGKLPESYLRR
jgi:hypothetical protein